MRIHCLTSSYPDAEQPFAGSFVREHCRVLAAAGCDVTVYTWRAGEALDDEEFEVVRVAPLGRASIFGGAGAPDMLEAEPWRVVEAPLAINAMLLRLLGDPAPDLYLGHWFVPGGLVARIAGAVRHVPSAVVGHSAGVHLLRRLPLGELWLRAIAAGPTTVPSGALADVVGSADVATLPMGYRPHRVDRGPAAPRVICFGRMVPIKGFDDVLEALVDLDVPIDIAGSGPNLPSLRARSAELGLDATFHGFVDRDRQRDLFSRSTVALFPSRVRPGGRHEGWPVSVLEVSSAGVIPLVADWPGSSEMVARPKLQVVKRGTTRSWRVAIDGILDLSAEELDVLRSETAAHAARFTWGRLSADWVGWVRRAAS